MNAKKTISILILSTLVVVGIFAESGRVIPTSTYRNNTNGRITVLGIVETLTGFDLVYRVENIMGHIGNYTFTIELERPRYESVPWRTKWVEQEYIVSNGRKELSFFAPYSSNIETASVSVNDD